MEASGQALPSRAHSLSVGGRALALPLGGGQPCRGPTLGAREPFWTVPSLILKGGGRGRARVRPQVGDTPGAVGPGRELAPGILAGGAA